MIVALNFIHLLSLVIWIGMLIFFSLFAAPSIFKVLPRETAGEVVGAIFPKYWMIGYISSIVALGSLIYLAYVQNTFPAARIAVLIIMTGVTFYSGLVVGARARAIKKEIKAAGTDEDKARLRGEFKKVHAKSSILNISVIILGVLVVYLTSTAMKL